MTIGRPMSEYESALSSVAHVLALTLIDVGADRSAFRSRLTDIQNDFESMGSKNGAASIELLIRAIFDPVSYRPTPPHLRVVEPE